MLFFWNNNMNDLKNSLNDQFQVTSFEEWKVDAQKYLKNRDIDDLISKKLTTNIDIKSIYNTRPTDSVELSFDKTTSSAVYSVSSDYILESDLEIAHLLHLLNNNDCNEVIVRAKINSNFFLSIAKFRALRYLLQNSELNEFIIEATSTNLNKSVIDENNNIIRLTTEAMSAKIGGCDSLDLIPYNSIDITLDNESTKFGSRLTQNIENLLNDESYFEKVSDPLAGSYLVEELTLKFIKSAIYYLEKLDNFSSEDEVNSFLKENSKNFLRTLNESLDKGDKKLIGVNIYQNADTINQTTNDNERLASDFEQLKIKVDSNKPKVYIANFLDKSNLQFPITMAMNTFNIEFEVNTLFELVEDCYNTVRLYDPDLVIVNGDDNVLRNLRNMLTEYSLVSINEFREDSILSNIEKIISKMDKVNNDK